MILAAIAFVVGFVLTIVFFALSKPFELFNYSTRSDVFIVLGLLSGLVTVCALVVMVVLAVRSALRSPKAPDDVDRGRSA